MTQEEFNEIARNIIKSNCYLTLATALDNEPWVAPLYYDIDEGYNFYYISQLSSKHTLHLLKNPHVAFAIFDSRQKTDTGNGVQGFGKVYQVLDKDLGEVFKLIPQKFYILDPEAKVDKRIEVFIL